MSGNLFRAIIMGAAGSGKGTIANRIVKDFGLKHLSSGDLLRAQMIAKTAAGMEAKKFIDQGALVPDGLMVELISSELKKMSDVSWLLDGFPRTLYQAEALQEREPVNAVVNLNVPFEIIIGRVKDRWVHLPSGRIYNTEFSPPKVPGKDDVTGEDLVQRDDDKPETVRARLESYEKITRPVLEFYKKKGILMEFTGKYSNEIWPHVHKHLANLTPALQYTDYGKGGV
ncbi:GTP:AMP phosphotransferase AK3, mitochondrial-like [Lingula anatina]|uniref:GTP:AMP phosphotransferase, mitochondrial n=1 Tax=Lingula anatina TaxID=7574 RepID=A0A1S3JVP3_LINAN|nr:GTP:AMP phosphotransferase AK3, mitochondrial-like [Lingula anatina]|eukprot:XP_013414367.1 GTP:AMP phosphotransferase AK3, mitochondrial-like [Lingula anatina]